MPSSIFFFFSRVKVGCSLTLETACDPYLLCRICH